MILSEKIVKIREENNFTQEEMAKKLFVSRQAISKYERGISYPSLEVLRLFSKEFKISMNSLLDINDSEKSKEYKAIGFKNFSFIFIYLGMLIMLIMLIVIITILNILLIDSNITLVENILYNSLLGLITLNVLYLLIKSIIPNSKVLIEYNDYGIKIKTIKETKEIPYK